MLPSLQRLFRACRYTSSGLGGAVASSQRRMPRAVIFRTYRRFIPRIPCPIRYTSHDSHLNRQETIDHVIELMQKDPTLVRGILETLKQDSNDDNNMQVIRFFVKEVKKSSVTKEEFKHWLHYRSTRGKEYSSVPLPNIEISRNEGGVAIPTTTQLMRLAVKSGVPFIGFGFLDNALMLLAGNEIETYFGASFGISALAAAALGNTISDMAGIQAGGIIENLAARMGIRDPDLSREQMNMNICKLLSVFASMIGIAIGCLIGMCPLLWIDQDKALREVFNSLDTGKKGYLEVKELYAPLQKLLGESCDLNLKSLFASLKFSDSDRVGFDDFKIVYNAVLTMKSLKKVVHNSES